jgi:penicillin-binding protein-related factor A (putative recombinase)
MELKIMTKVQAFPFNKVTEWQVHNLREVEKNGGNAFIVINYRSRQISEQARKRFDLGKTINTVFVIPIAVFDDLDNKIDSKSMAYGDISGNSVFQLFKRDSFWEIPIMIGD